MDFLLNGYDAAYRNAVSTTRNTTSGAGNTGSTNGTEGTSSVYYANGANSSNKTRGKGEMDMSDFLQLLVAQLTNQDMMNPVSDTDFIAQMAQFAALQGVNTLQEYALSSYAVSYVGKNVLIATQDKHGSLTTITGLVERVTFSGGTPKVVVNGLEYDLHTVMEISSEPFEPEDNNDSGDGNNTDPGGTGGE